MNPTQEDAFPFISCYPKYFEYLNDLHPALMLSNIHQYYLPDKDGKFPVAILCHYWIANTHEERSEERHDECFLSPYKMGKSPTLLEGHDIIKRRSIKRCGIKTLHLCVIGLKNGQMLKAGEFFNLPELKA
jgi:hypothetical protein